MAVELESGIVATVQQPEIGLDRRREGSAHFAVGLADDSLPVCDEALGEPKSSILLVDDNPANLVALEALLDDLGQNLVKAHSGDEALCHLFSTDFAVVLLDVQMPGLDGFQIARLIRRRQKSRRTPVIFLTAEESPHFPVVEAYELGAVDFLVKPFLPVVLKAKVAVFVELFQKAEQVKRQTERLRELERQEFERRLAQQKLRQTEELYREARVLAEELEQRVLERTGALEAANRKLQREITEHQRTAAELLRSNRELEDFAYVASHDLKEPLRKIRIYLQLLEQRYRGRLDAKADDYIRHAVDSAGRMQALVQDVLTYARVGRQGGASEPTDCAAVFDQAVANLQTTIHETQAAVTHGPLPRVCADRTKLVQLFENLLGNALKFRNKLPPVVRVEAAAANGECLFAVRDNGIGIDPQYAERIFVPFERLHTQSEYPGTGIGLAICKKIVEGLGGRIWVDSQLDKGATFWFTLPGTKEQTP
jgi:signal transduction histidine kinase